MRTCPLDKCILFSLSCPASGSILIFIGLDTMGRWCELECTLKWLETTLCHEIHCMHAWENNYGMLHLTVRSMVCSIWLLEVIYQTLAQVFHHVSKHQERKLKNETQPSFLTKVLGVWKHDQTLVRVFDTTSQTNTCFRRKRGRKFG